MRTRADLRGYQNRVVKFVKRRRFAALLIDMGLGKTASVLTAIVDMIRSAEVETVLVVAPVRVVYGVWRQEAKLWAHTRKLRFSVVHGTARERAEALHKPAHVYLINPEGLKWLREYYKGKAWPFDMLVVDESSMFKKPNTARFKALRYGLRHFKRRVIMTGTPTPNSLLELWPQMFIVDCGMALGTRYTDYKQQHFKKTGYMGYKLEALPGAREVITEAIGPRVVSLRSEDWLTLPKFVDVPVWVDLPLEARRLYEQLETSYFAAFEEGEVDIENAAGLSNRTSQLASGALWLKHPETGQKVWRPIHDAKLNALGEIIDELHGEPPFIGYRFQHDRERIQAMYPKFVAIGKGTPAKAIVRIEARWNAGRIPGLIAHPASAGHGLNLQQGGRHIIWFSPTWSLEQYLQFVKRIHRSGVRGRVFNYLILARGTTDEAVMEAIQHKDDGQEAVKNALYEYYEAFRRRRLAA